MQVSIIMLDYTWYFPNESSYVEDLVKKTLYNLATIPKHNALKMISRW